MEEFYLLRTYKNDTQKCLNAQLINFFKWKYAALGIHELHNI